MYTFGGPWPFSVILSCFLVLLALLLSTLRVKFVGYGSYRDADSIEPHSHRHFPHLLSLSEVLITITRNFNTIPAVAVMTLFRCNFCMYIGTWN